MKPKKMLSILLSLCMLMTLLPVTALAAESLDAIKTDPGKTYTYQDDDGNSHSQTVNTTFDFVVDNVAYRYLNGADGDEVAVAEWSWSYSCINCGMGDKHMNVLHHSFYSGTVNVPSSVQCDNKTYNVTAVDNNAFASFTGTVTLSEGIKTIGRDSFYNYHPSEDAVFTVPSSVTEIGEGCFERTTATVQFAEDSELKTVGATAFAQLTQSTLVLPDGLETLGDRVFENSNNTAVTIPGTVTNLTTSVLSGYTGTPSFTEGPANFEIKDGVLYGWGKLIQVRDKAVTSITVPEGITEIISPLAFANMSTLKTVNLPSTLTTIGYGAFSNSGIERIVIPASVTIIQEAPSSNVNYGLFSGCTSLKSVEIQGNWDAIPDYTFYNCTALETVQFPASVTAVGDQAFQKCSALQTVDLSNIETIGEQAFRQSGISDVGSLDRLQSMGQMAFAICTNLTSIVLPEGVTSIEKSTFNGCTGLDLLVLPSTITNIGSSALALGSSSDCNLVMNSVALSDVNAKAFGSSGKPESLTVYYPAEAQKAYETAGLIDEGDTNGYALSLTDSSMALASGENSSTLTLKATVPTGMTLVTTSSNTAVATADGATITGVTEGTATITAQLKVGEYVVLEDSCTVTVTAEGAVIPTVEEPETSVSDSITEEADKTTATNVAGSVVADETITSAAQSAANSLNSSAEKESLIEKGKENLAPTEEQKVSLYTQTYLNIEATELTKTESTVTSITLNITPMMQVVASTATNSADVNLAEDGNAVVVKNPAPLTIRNASKITVTLPNNFANHTVYVKHQASNGGTYFYQATADSTGKVTFTSTHGFSPFTFSLNNEAVAFVDGIGYASFQEAVNSVADGDVVEVFNDDNLTATVSGSSRTIKVKNLTGNSITVTLNGQTMTIDNGATQEYTYTRPSSGGGSSVTTYAISTPSKVSNGTIKVSPTRASKGTTVTITVTPDEGYELAKLTVTDKDGDTVKLTDKGNGKYTFTMPASAVEVEVSFQEIVIEPDNPFTDVSTSDYYYDAVLWAVKNGVTNGTSATTFGPNMAVSRAQMVTFLWRAHGSPKATGTNPFTDVSTSDYYYDAVLWAVANGVTNGTSATTFSPDMAVTRAQAVTFQWRAAGSPVVSGSSFGDVATDAYYVNAVTWAVANGITNGTGGNTFSPDVVVSRAQAVTFLYREQE